MQLVNFYFEEYRPKPLTFNSKFAAVAMMVALVGFLVLGWQESEKRSQFEQILAQKNIDLNRTQKELTEAQKQLAKRLNRGDFEAQLAKSQKELNSYKRLLNTVNLPSHSSRFKYSEIFNDLSKQPAENIWLTKIGISAQSLNLHGSTIQPDAIPVYVGQLNQSPSLTRYFEELKIERDKLNKQQVNFELNNGRLTNEF